MKTIANELQQIILDFHEKLNAIPDEEFSLKENAGKWSKKEVIGHLIDSAQNNLRRFITSQYELIPPKIYYNQDFWVNVNGYQQMKKDDIIHFWKLINERIINVLSNIPKDYYHKMCDTSPAEIKLHTLHWLADDYVRHLKHHLNQVIPASYEIKYQ